MARYQFNPDEPEIDEAIPAYMDVDGYMEDFEGLALDPFMPSGDRMSLPDDDIVF